MNLQILDFNNFLFNIYKQSKHDFKTSIDIQTGLFEIRNINLNKLIYSVKIELCRN